MPRSKRIQYPNAFYHVMNRGRGRENIFHDKSLFQLFLDLICESNREFDAIIHSYCLMSNHYHILMETPDANLSEIMHFIGKNFVTEYNKIRKVDGSLFKGRYKAILVDKESYLIELNRYIHRNPIKMVGNLRNYKWSSYPAYLNISKTPSWLNKEETLRVFGYENNLEGYVEFVEKDREQEVFKKRKNIPTIIGDKGFKERVKIFKK